MNATEKIVRLRDQDGLSWKQIADAVKKPVQTVRSTYRRNKVRELPTCILECPEPVLPDEELVYKRALKVYGDKLKHHEAKRKLEFSGGPIAMVFFADHHFGDSGTNVKRAFEEAELVMSTPGAYIGLVGDLVNNYILDKLMRERFNSDFTIQDEWALVRRYLQVVGPKLKLVVRGNHDYWTQAVCGIDYLYETVSNNVGNIIYAANDCKLDVVVGGAKYPGRVRHAWRNNSMYNPSHGIECAARADQDFIWAVGAHRHTGGVAREFDIGGKLGIAAICGSYKKLDDYADRLGFPYTNDAVGVTIIFTENGMFGTANLSLAMEYMREMY